MVKNNKVYGLSVTIYYRIEFSVSILEEWCFICDENCMKQAVEVKILLRFILNVYKLY